MSLGITTTGLSPASAGPVARGRAAARRDPVGTTSMLMLIALALAAILAPLIAPYDPDKQSKPLRPHQAFNTWPVLIISAVTSYRELIWGGAIHCQSASAPLRLAALDPLP